MFMHRGEKGGGGSNFRLFADVTSECNLTNSFLLLNIFFCFSLSLHSLLFHSFFYCFCMLSKRDNQNFKKRRGRENLKINLKMHHTQVSFGLKNHEIK